MTENKKDELFDPRPGDGYEVPVDSEGNPITEEDDQIYDSEWIERTLGVC